jgi:DNA-binding transcriptional ArsR family regulator
MTTTSVSADAFAAVAEPHRRQILDLLAGAERPVGDLVAALRLSQPLVSKHLRVLRTAGLVVAREEGRQRIYRVDARALKPIADWVAGYAKGWDERFDRLDGVLAELKEKGDRR